MEETNIRFEDLPEAVQWIKNKLTEIPTDGTLPDYVLFQWNSVF